MRLRKLAIGTVVEDERQRRYTLETVHLFEGYNWGWLCTLDGKHVRWVRNLGVQEFAREIKKEKLKWKRA